MHLGIGEMQGTSKHQLL